MREALRFRREEKKGAGPPNEGVRLAAGPAGALGEEYSNGGGEVEGLRALRRG
jgi:hypothetical protein